MLQWTNTSLLLHPLQAALASGRMDIFELVIVPSQEKEASLHLGAARHGMSGLMPAMGCVALLCSVEG